MFQDVRGVDQIGACVWDGIELGDVADQIQVRVGLGVDVQETGDEALAAAEVEPYRRVAMRSSPAAPWRWRRTRQGLPQAMLLSGMSRVTTEPAPITAPEPMCTPGAITAPMPIQTSSPRRIGSASVG